MKYSFILAGCLAACMAVACSDDDVAASLPLGEELPATAEPEAWHDQVRMTPYPKAGNEIFVNPPPLIVHETAEDGERIQFALSSDADFSPEATTLSEAVTWHIFNVHRRLEDGTWYWRYRYYDGETPRAWSETYSFEITPDIPVFVTPEADKFLDNLPTAHPRLYCFLDYNIGQARQRVKEHAEYTRLVNRANTVCELTYEPGFDPFVFGNVEGVKTSLNYLYDAYHLTQDAKYLDEMLELLRTLLLPHLSGLTDDKLYANNFGACDGTYALAQIYDMAYDRILPDEKTQMERQMMRVLKYYHERSYGKEENRFFDNHFWQHNMRILFQTALVLYDKAGYEECRDILEYYYELWTARAPDGGHNRSGVWKNGTGYFNANIRTLSYMPLMFGSLTGADFLAHPWYRNAGQALLYTWPPQSQTAGFGDGSEGANGPTRQRAAFADFLARETGDGYAAWYAAQCAEDVLTDVDQRLYRMVTDKTYTGADFPSASSKLLWYKDAGEVAIHSDLEHTDRNMTLSFRSSTFGGNSHTLANQNSFNLLYKGLDVLCNGGYYVGSGNQPYNLLCYRHTRGHNTILVNGIGQPYSLEAYGQVLRAMSGDHIAYCLGDASHAYYGITDQKGWVERLEDNGITQTPEFGFGETPLEKYKRHILVLFPRTVVIYDELEASEPVEWDWLLHSPLRFAQGSPTNQWYLENESESFRVSLSQFSALETTFAQTDTTMVPITPEPDPAYPPLWHFTSTSNGARNRILTILQVADEEEEIPDVTHDGDTFRIGQWTVKAALDPQSPPELAVEDADSRAAFSYSRENPLLDGSVYLRRYQYSSVLYDEKNGRYVVEEQADFVPPYTRMAD